MFVFGGFPRVGAKNPHLVATLEKPSCTGLGESRKIPATSQKVVLCNQKQQVKINKNASRRPFFWAGNNNIEHMYEVSSHNLIVNTCNK